MNRSFARVRALLFAAASAASLGACSADAASRDKPPAANNSVKASAVAAHTIDFGNAAYHVVSLGAVGSVSGTVTLGPSAGAGQTALSPTPAKRASSKASSDSNDAECTLPPSSTSAKGGAENVVVWVAGAASGKPFSEERRAELASEKCQLDPRVQAVEVGTTINVINDDKILHRLIFVRDGTRDTLTTMPFYNIGEIVASERLAKAPGLVDVTCALHPLTRGYVVVFAHPYFAVTDDAGKFTIDSLPPGSYRLMTWRPGDAKPAEQPLNISAGAATKADVVVR